MPDASRVLVTGGAGFIGTALCQAWLARGATVFAYDDLSANNRRILSIRHPRLTVHHGSVVDAQETRDAILAFRPTHLYHLAALHYIPACERDPLRALSVNVTGTEAVLLGAEEAGIEQFILASSAAVYSDSDHPLGESHPTGPQDIYGLTKVFAEQLCRRFHARTGRTTTICRFFNVYGPGDTIPHIIPEILNQLAGNDTTLHLGSLTPKRDFVAVADVVDALTAVVSVPAASCEAFNVGSGKDYSVQDLVQLIETALGTQLTIVTDESRVRRVERLRLVADIAKIRHYTDWTPRIHLLAGLIETITAHPKLGERFNRKASSG